MHTNSFLKSAVCSFCSLSLKTSTAFTTYLTQFNLTTKKIVSSFCFTRKAAAFSLKFIVCGDMLLAEICAPKRNLIQRLKATTVNFISLHLYYYYKTSLFLKRNRQIKLGKFILSVTSYLRESHKGRTQKTKLLLFPA